MGTRSRLRVCRLDAATQVLVDIGYSDTTTNKIADCAGVSIGSLYEYFPGKEAIFAELPRPEERKLFDIAMSFGEPKSIRDLIRKHHSSYVKFIRTNLTLHVALLNEVPHFAVDEKEPHIHKVYFPWVVEFFRSHQEELRPFKDITQLVEFTSVRLNI